MPLAEQPGALHEPAHVQVAFQILQQAVAFQKRAVQPGRHGQGFDHAARGVRAQ